MDVKKLGVRNLEVFSNTDERGNIKVNYDLLRQKENMFNELLESLIDLMTSPALNGYADFLDNGRYSLLVEKITGKQFKEIREMNKPWI